MSLVRRLHRDERGTLSIVSVFALVLLVFLLGMVVNAARQVDHKVKLQNAADSATYAGGIVVTRSMNTLAFTNHLISDVFALTAFMREARDRTAESLTPAILDNWERVAPGFIGSEFPPFDQLGYAIQEKVPRERELVLAYGNWAYAGSELMLPVLETILAEELIPNFQRALTVATPVLTQYAVDEMARRHGQAWPRQSVLHGVLWRTVVDPVGGESEVERRTLPVVDPLLNGVPWNETYFLDAVRQRHDLARRYLNDWNNESMEVFDRYGKMSQYSNLWRIFTCGQLEHLLNIEYPQSNLPYQIRTKLQDITDSTQHLELDFTFVGVVYRETLSDKIPRVFRNPIAFDSQAYAEIRMFVPRRRLIRVRPGTSEAGTSPIGGIPGTPTSFQSRPQPTDQTEPPDPDEDDLRITVRQSVGWNPEHWDLLNQHWGMQLVPATSPSILGILSKQPAINNLPAYNLPDLSGLSEVDLQWLSHH